jgi:hypothetical protein
MRREQLICTIALIGATAALSVGCVAHAQAGGHVEAEPVVFVEPPTLVSVDADVWVVRNYDYPVYYVSGFYWVFKDGAWYKTRSYDHGWVTVEASVVPSIIVHRNHTMYVRFQGDANAQTKPAPKETVASEPTPAGPPGLTGTAPGQAKKEEGGMPPGLAKKEEPGVPPGQAKKDDAPGPGAGAPPGQAKKDDAPGPGAGAPPGQAKKDDKKGGPPGKGKK